MNRRTDLGFGKGLEFEDKKWLLLYQYAARIDYEKRNGCHAKTIQNFFQFFPGLVLPQYFSAATSREALLGLLVAHNAERKSKGLANVLETYADTVADRPIIFNTGRILCFESSAAERIIPRNPILQKSL
eukprot:Gregarina_sp_Poly_1__1547@NODE_1390_length_4230_cov_10_732164_g929_i0_p3_GENE_NODE_1390_length_4230_cov_10_732164_g929_i0NODE_1390_length_4230_cov_10_732164_g929_i0_p3_ORF_typecomplete_len130_score13_00DUF4054/PF13262_6/0_19_NODE_1390_length_4230_cov_10_732164_g929_i035113900